MTVLATAGVGVFLLLVIALVWLWGGFGYRTSSQGLLHMYISRIDWSVLIQVRGDRPWMITPARPEEFVEALGLQSPS